MWFPSRRFRLFIKKSSNRIGASGVQCEDFTYGSSKKVYFVPVIGFSFLGIDDFREG